MLKRFLGAPVLAGLLSGLWGWPLVAQPFDLINIKRAQVIFLRNAVLLDISGCFVLGEGSDGIDPTTGENPALSFTLGPETQIISKNIQTSSFKVLRDDGGTVVGYATGPTFGSEGDTPGMVRVRLRHVNAPPKPRSPDPCKQKGDFWRFEIRGSVSQASQQFRQPFLLTIGNDTSGGLEVQVAVRLGRRGLGTSFAPVEELTIFDLQGRPLFQSPRASELNSVRKSLAPGVYLILVTVRGADGQLWRREVRKLIVR